MSYKKMWKKEDVGLDDDGIEMDTEKIVLGEEELLKNEAFFNPEEKIQIEKEENIENDLGRKKSTIFKEEYEKFKKEEEESIRKEEKRKRILREGFEAMDNSDDLNSNYVSNDFNVKHSNPNNELLASKFEPQKDKDKAIVEKSENKNEETKKNESPTVEIQKEEDLIDFDELNDINGNIKRCLESIGKYKEKREELGKNDFDNLLNFTPEIYDNFDKLLFSLSGISSVKMSIKNNNLSVRPLSVRPGGRDSSNNVNSPYYFDVNLEELKEIFFLIKEFANDPAMVDFSGKFNNEASDSLNYFKEFKQNVEKHCGSIEILNEIDAINQNLIEQNNALNPEDKVQTAPNLKVKDAIDIDNLKQKNNASNSGSKSLTSEFEVQKDRDKILVQKNELKKENTERNVSSITEIQEEEKNSISYKLFNIGGNLDRCLELLDEYKVKRKLEPNTADNSSDFKKLGLNIFNDVVCLMNNLSNRDLQIISADGDNLSVKLYSQKSNLNLKKLKELFLSIRRFSSDYEMYRFTTDQFSDIFNYHENIYSIYSRFEKFKQKCSEKNISNKNLDEIDDIFVDLRKMYCGKTPYTYGENNPKDNQTPLSDSFRKKVKQYNNIKKFFIGLTRKFEDLTRKVFRKLEDFNRKVGKKSAKFIYGGKSKSFREVSMKLRERKRISKLRREKEDQARQEKRDREDWGMENNLIGNEAFRIAAGKTANEMSKKTNEDIAKMEKNRSKGQNSGLNFSSN